MYGGMAVRATSVEVFDGAQRLRLRGMPAAVVAGVTNARHAYLEQLRIVRAMRLVAICAIFHHWRVRPQEGPSAFGMATDAILVCGALNEQAGIWCAVRIVAARAGHFALAIRHVRGAL